MGPGVVGRGPAETDAELRFSWLSDNYQDVTGIDPATGQTAPMRPRAIDILPVLQAAVTNATSLTVRVLAG